MTAPTIAYSIKYNGVDVPLGSSIRASFVSGHNQVVITYNSDISLSKYLVWVSKADSEYGVGIGNLAYSDSGSISASLDHTFTLTFTGEVFDLGDVDYVIGLYGKSAAEDVWDATQILISATGDTLCNSEGTVLEAYTSGH